MAVGMAATKGAEEILKKLQQMLIKAKDSGNKARAAEIEKKIAQAKQTISKANEAKKVKEGKAVPKMSRKEQEKVKKNIKKDLGGKTEAVKRKEAAAYAKAATSPEAKKTSGSVATKRGRRNKTNQYEAGRYKGRTSKKPGEMYKASPNTPETVAGKKVTKNTAKKPTTRTARKNQPLTSPRSRTMAAKEKAAKRAQVKKNTGMTPIGGKSTSSKGALTIPKSSAPSVKRTSSQTKAGNISTRVEKDMGKARRVDPATKTTRSMAGGRKSDTPASSRRNAAARKASPAKKRGSTLKKAATVGAGLGGIGYMLGRDDGKKKSEASPTKPASKPKPKRVTTGTGGNANRTNRTSVTSGATKPRKKDDKKKKSRVEKKWGTLRWGDEGSLPQVQYRKRKRK